MKLKKMMATPFEVASLAVILYDKDDTDYSDNKTYRSFMPAAITLLQMAEEALNDGEGLE